MTVYRIVGRWVSFVVAATILSGCISIGGSSNSKGEPPADTYTLRASPSNKPAGAATGATTAIVVSIPDLPTGFETDRIALYFERGHQLDYYANARWSGRLDELLQNFIIQSARHAFPKAVVGTDDLSSSAKYKIGVKITDFQPVYSGGPDGIPRLDVAMTMTLIALPAGTVKASITTKRSVVASANRMTIVTSELEALLQSSTDQALRGIAPHIAKE